MDDVGRCILNIFFSILFLAIAGYISSAKRAIELLGDAELKRLEEEEDHKAIKLIKLKNCKFSFSTWIDVSFITCISASILIGVNLLGEYLYKFFIKAGSVATVISYTLAFLIVSFFAIVLGKTFPKKLSVKNYKRLAFSCVPIISLLGTFFRPLTFLIFKTTNGVARLFGIDPNREDKEITEDTIRMMVDEGNVNGTIELQEREMINNIFEFDDRTAGDVMTHRTDIVAVSIDDKLIDVVKSAVAEGFSRILIYKEDIDDIIGTVYVKDLLKFLGEENLSGQTIKGFMRKVIYVPESAKCLALFKEFKDKKTHLAVVVDEYGGTAGIVTMEDLLESIVGNIQDEYDQEDDEYKKIDDNVYIFDGAIEIEQLSKVLSTDIETDEYTETLGGLITNTLGVVPDGKQKLSVTINNILFNVLSVEDRRIIKVKATILPSQDEYNE